MIPRCEHPRPQFMRENWQSLNGQWQFEIDNGRSGEARGLMAPETALSDVITVPFCPQSRLSGVEHKDFIYGLWYKRALVLTKEQLAGLVHIYFGAVDYRCTLYVNGKKAGGHVGGYTSFTLDITEYVQEGENCLALYVEDDERDPMIARGKQSEEYFSHGCDYTRTSGIWQSVYVEFLPKNHVESFRIVTSPETASVAMTLQLKGEGTLTAQALWNGKTVGTAAAMSKGGALSLTMPLSESHLWEVGKGGLYDLILTYEAPCGCKDVVTSYFGLRSVSLNEKACLINGEPVFQRTVLDQGFYPDGIYTAPSDEELKGDILRSMAMGFNGARLHQKTFEERFLYHADKLGYLVWGEYANWGLDHTNPMAIYSFLPLWLEEINRDFNHPSIIGWCPFNETWDQNGRPQFDDLLKNIYLATKAADPTRPCIDTSGNFHVITDLYDMHDYEQDVEKFAATYVKEGRIIDRFAPRQEYLSGPLFVSEYGGIGFDPAAVLKASGDNHSDAWSYGNSARSLEEYIERFRGLTDVLLDNPQIMGLCYTQLTDIEQEQNGVYTYDRQPKVDPQIFHEILSRKAAIEK